MSSKNNPEMRGKVTELRKFKGQEVRPALYINPTKKARFFAAVDANGNLVLGDNGEPVPYQSV